jgi:hypothetical protein
MNGCKILHHYSGFMEAVSAPSADTLERRKIKCTSQPVAARPFCAPRPLRGFESREKMPRAHLCATFTAHLKTT